jgi:hypothetical protein
VSNASNYQLQTYILPPPGNNPVGPYLIPPLFPGTKQSLNMVIYNVAGTGAGQNTCGIQPDNKSNFDFSLKWATDNQQQVYAQVGVSAAHVFSDAPADRQVLLASYQAFCTAMEKMELASQTSQQCMLPGGAAAIANQIAGALPLRVDEIFPY